MKDLNSNPFESALRDWAEEQGSGEIVRIPPGLILLKARLARQESRQAKVRSLQRWTLSTVALVAVASSIWPHPRGSQDLQLLTLGGLSSLLPLLIAPAIFTASVAWLLED